MVAEGLYAWSDEGKEVSVRDLALSMALPERRVRVILSVLEAMGVAEEVKAARWKGVEPKPTREQIDKAAMVFEARRISDRRRLSSLLSYMNTQKCRVQMLRAYFGEPEGAQCGLCDSDAGLDSEVFDTASADERHGLHAATDFHARPRRRRRGRGAGQEAPMHAARRRHRRHPGSRPRFRATSCRRCRRSRFRLRPTASRRSTKGCGQRPTRARATRCPATRSSTWRSTTPARLRRRRAATGAAAETDTGAATPATEQDFNTGWAAIRDANIRPYAEWRAGAPVTLPVLVARPVSGGGHQGNHPGHHGHGGGRRRRRRRSPPSPGAAAGPAADSTAAAGGGGGGKRKRRRGRNRDRDNSRDNNRRDHHRHRDRERGPRLPGVLQSRRRLDVAAVAGGD